MRKYLWKLYEENLMYLVFPIAAIVGVLFWNNYIGGTLVRTIVGTWVFLLAFAVFFAFRFFWIVDSKHEIGDTRSFRNFKLQTDQYMMATWWIWDMRTYIAKALVEHKQEVESNLGVAK